MTDNYPRCSAGYVHTNAGPFCQRCWAIMLSTHAAFVACADCQDHEHCELTSHTPPRDVWETLQLRTPYRLAPIEVLTFDRGDVLAVAGEADANVSAFPESAPFAICWEVN